MSFFEKELELCKKIFDSHSEKKGDSYKTCNIQYLRNKLVEEFDEWSLVCITPNEIDELADIINVALMLMYRIEAERGGGVQPPEI